MNLKIELEWSYLKVEIDYETYKAAEITMQDAPVAKEEAQADDTKADEDFCRAKIDAAVGNLEEIMHRHFLVTSEESHTNQLSRTKTSWVLNLLYADNSRRSINLNSLTTKCHRYVVAYVLAEWCKLALPNLVQSYTDKMEAEKQGIESLVNRKESPTLFDDDTSTEIDTTIDGLTATVAIETVESNVSPSATVTITKTTSGDKEVPCLNFKFKIPQGVQGIQGIRGLTGETGAQGIQGDTGVVDYAKIEAYIDQKIAEKTNTES